MDAENLTFRSLDSDVSLTDPIWPLEVWYADVRDIPLNKLTDGDLARASRQQLYLEHAVPISIGRLENEPMAGEMYDGELIVALKEIPSAYWAAHPDQKKTFLSIGDRAYSESEDPLVHFTEETLGKH